MEKLSSQDVGFLKIESAHCPFHVAGLIILKKPASAPAGYVRRLVRNIGRINQVWPIYNKKLKDPEDLSDAAWVAADDYVPERHVFHYALPQPGRMSDLLQLVTRAHERPLDRSRPLWETHVIEGLPGDRFALYCKVHHSLVDGVGAMRMIQSLFSESPGARIDYRTLQEEPSKQDGHHSLFESLGDITRGVWQQYKALPELSGLLAHMGLEEGDPSFESIELKCFASTFDDEDKVRNAWDRAVARSPIAATLTKAVELDIKLAIV